MLDFKNFVESHTLRSLTLGKSGAEVCLLDDHKIAKFAEKGSLLQKENGEAVWESCLKEAKFYKKMMDAHYAFLPEIFTCDFDDETVRLIMGEYKAVKKESLGDNDFDKIMKLLAMVHELPVPDFLKNDKPGPVEISQEEIQNCLAGWKSIFEEHQSDNHQSDDSQRYKLLAEPSDILDFSKIQDIAARINQLNKDLYSERICVCHGDFHAENILCDEKSGQLVLCDWQSVSLCHPATDVAFFMSRLQGDGIAFDENKIIDSYCEWSKSGITKDEIKTQMALADINTTFRYWHYYLHGSAKEFVEGIVEKMLIAQAGLI